jgi:hypothetical protein
MTDARAELSPRPVSPTGWLSLALASAALLGLLVLAVIAKNDGLKRLVPADAPMGGKEHYETYVAPVIELVTGFGFFAGAAAAGLAIVDLVKARKRSPPTSSGVPVIALLLGLVAMPAAIVAFVMTSLMAGPWPFG